MIALGVLGGPNLQGFRALSVYARLPLNTLKSPRYFPRYEIQPERCALRLAGSKPLFVSRASACVRIAHQTPRWDRQIGHSRVEAQGHSYWCSSAFL